MNLYIIILIIYLINILPIVKINYKEIKTNKIITIIYSLLAILIDLLLVIGILKLNSYLVHTIILGITALVFNYCVIKEWFDIKKVPKSFGVLLLFFFSVVLQFIPIIIFNLDLDNITYSEQMYLTTFSDLVSLILLIFIYFKELKDDFKKIKGNFYKMMDTGIKYWILGGIIMFISNLLIMIFFKDATAVNENGVQELIHSSRYLSLLTIGVIAPIVEELTFRKAFRDVIKNDFAYILTSGLVFGALHVVLSLSSPWDLLYIIPYSSLGMAFAKTYVKTKNIYTSIILHIAHNTILTLISILGMGVILL